MYEMHVSQRTVGNTSQHQVSIWWENTVPSIEADSPFSGKTEWFDSNQIKVLDAQLSLAYSLQYCDGKDTHIKVVRDESLGMGYFPNKPVAVEALILQLGITRHRQSKQ